VAQRDGGVLDLRHARHPQQPERRRQVAQVQVCDIMIAMSEGLGFWWSHVCTPIKLLTVPRLTLAGGDIGDTCLTTSNAATLCDTCQRCTPATAVAAASSLLGFET
jgi:hypothetical protein